MARCVKVTVICELLRNMFALEVEVRIFLPAANMIKMHYRMLMSGVKVLIQRDLESLHIRERGVNLLIIRLN